MTQPLKTNQDFFTEHEIDFKKTLGKLIYLDKNEVPEYQSLVIHAETGEVLTGALVNEETGRLIEGSVPEGVPAEVRSRPVEGTCVAYDLILEAEAFGSQIVITVPATISVETLVYNREIQLLGLSARHWSRTTRQVNNGRVTFSHTQGFKLRAEGLLEKKSKAAPLTRKRFKADSHLIGRWHTIRPLAATLSALRNGTPDGVSNCWIMPFL